MADFSKPDSTSLYTAVWSLLQSVITSVVTMFDGTSDTNIPNKAKRYNTTTNKFEVYNSGSSTWSTLPFHTAIDNHIADTTLHTGVPTGGIIAYGGASAPTNFLLCQGQAVSRTTYAALFAIIGTTYGGGDGSTTFNVPNLQQRFPLGKAASGTGNTLGATGGAIDHNHSFPNHAHAIAQHTHTMKSHYHTIGNHNHSTPAHEHLVPGHGHSSTHPWANIQISVASGSHQHDIPRRGAAGANSGDSRVSMTNGTAGADTGGTTVSNSVSNHTHPHSSFSGTVGAWDGGGTGTNGDGAFATYGYGGGTTGDGGAGNTSGPSDNTTDVGGPTSTSTDGGGTTGNQNPPFLVVNYIIRI